MKKCTTHSAALNLFLGLIPVAALAVMPSSAFADNIGWYDGFSVGQARTKVDDTRTARDLLGPGYTTTTIANQDNDTAYKLFAGYQFNSVFSMEFGYFHLGKYSFTDATVPAGTFGSSAKIDGFNMDIIGSVPVTEKFSLFARVGVNLSESKYSFTQSGAVHVANLPNKEKNSNAKFGVGVQYDFNDSFAMRIQAERYRINDAYVNKGNIDVSSIGLIYRFGS